MEVIKRNLIGRVDSVRTSFIELRKLKRRELLFIFFGEKKFFFDQKIFRKIFLAKYQLDMCK